MKPSAVVVIILCLLLCSCADQRQGKVRTAADLDAATWRAARQYQRSQLTNNPQQNLDSPNLSFHLFFQLPLEERVICIMDSFAKSELDGEFAERMYAMLKDRTEPKNWWETPHPLTAEDLAYTNAIFRTMDSFSDDQVRRFCLGFGDAALFRKNLKRWKRHCDYNG